MYQFYTLHFPQKHSTFVPEVTYFEATIPSVHVVTNKELDELA